MITNFNIFEQVDSAVQDENSDSWKLSLDISNLWSAYSNGSMSLSNFNTQYINFLNQYRELISQRTGEGWFNLQEIISKLEEKKDNLKSSRNLWDDIYDWGDKFLVEILSIKKDF